MDCSRALPSDSQNRLAEFSKKLRGERIPTSGGIEITRRCNLDCLHCYQRGCRKNKQAAREELSTETWKKIVDQIAEAGCIFLLFTGGEPFVRKDFLEIHAHAKASGLLTTVFTNGYHVPEETFAAFDEYPPDNVEISIYGASPETYKAVTGRADGFEKCRRNLDRMLRAGLRVRVKTMLTTLNRDDFGGIEQIARERGLKFRFDALLFGGFDGDRSPLGYRVAPEEVVEKNLADQQRKAAWMDFYQRTKNDSLSDVMYGCGAGLTNFHIGPSGMLSPCVILDRPRYDLKKGSFADGWKNAMPEIRKKKTPAAIPCRSCNFHAVCGYCPAFFKLETGAEEQISPYLCEIGRMMAERLEYETRRRKETT